MTHRRDVRVAVTSRRAKEVRSSARHEHPTQHRLERLDRDVSPGAGRDRSGGNVRLLCRQPTLFDRKPGRVARGPNSLEPGDVHRRVRLHKPVLPLRKPREGLDLECRQSDRRVRGDGPIGV